MEALEIIGLISGCCALFFAIVAGLTYFRINKLLSLISEDVLDQAMPIVEKQRRRVYAYVILSCIFTVITVVLSIIA